VFPENAPSLRFHVLSFPYPGPRVSAFDLVAQSVGIVDVGVLLGASVGRGPKDQVQGSCCISFSL
jgi:hypothetical protein